ncbi:MAG: hypothetical protein HQK83_13580 [Fibrobacteria bacterium]|nr:hypothetical protein [Fibrobacteria bacterium]
MKKIILIAVALCLCNCARTYKQIGKQDVRYSKGKGTDLEFEYKHNVLADAGNTTYVKKEQRQNLSIVAVRLKNTTSNVIEVKRDVTFYDGRREFIPMSTMTAAKSIKQGTPWYLFYLLFLPINVWKSELKCDSYDGCEEKVSVLPIGLILGPALTLFNMVMSTSANTSMINEIGKNDFFEKTIKPGETVSGFLAMKGSGSSPLTVRLNTEQAPENKHTAEEDEDYEKSRLQMEPGEFK